MAQQVSPLVMNAAQSLEEALVERVKMNISMSVKTEQTVKLIINYSVS